MRHYPFSTGSTLTYRGRYVQYSVQRERGTLDFHDQTKKVVALLINYCSEDFLVDMWYMHKFIQKTNISYPLCAERKLNVYMTFRRRTGRTYMFVQFTPCVQGVVLLESFAYVLSR